MTVSTKFHANPSRSNWWTDWLMDISDPGATSLAWQTKESTDMLVALKTTNVNAGATRGKVMGRWMSIHKRVADIFQSEQKWPTNKDRHPWSRALAKKYDMHTVCVIPQRHSIAEQNVSVTDWWDRNAFFSLRNCIIWREFGFELRLAKSHRFAHRSLVTTGLCQTDK